MLLIEKYGWKVKEIWRKFRVNHCIELLCKGTILILLGYHEWFYKLSDSVLITLLSISTADVLGVLIIVIKYLFANNSKH